MDDETRALVQQLVAGGFLISQDTGHSVLLVGSSRLGESRPAVRMFYDGGLRDCKIEIEFDRSLGSRELGVWAAYLDGRPYTGPDPAVSVDVACHRLSELVAAVRRDPSSEAAVRAIDDNFREAARLRSLAARDKALAGRANWTRWLISDLGPVPDAAYLRAEEKGRTRASWAIMFLISESGNLSFDGVVDGMGPGEANKIKPYLQQVMDDLMSIEIDWTGEDLESGSRKATQILAARHPELDADALRRLQLRYASEWR